MNENNEIAARLLDFEARGAAAQAKAAQAFARLLHLAESRDSGQVRCIAQFLASTHNGSAFPWDPFDLRALDVEISDDMLSCLAALRWGKVDLYRLVPDGERRIEAVIDDWGITKSNG